LTQETFYQTVRYIDKFDKSCKIATWLCAIAKNQLLSYNRKHPRTEELESVSIPTGGVEGQVLSDMGKVDMLKMIHLLDDPFKEVMYLRVFGDLSFKEIGEVLNQSENWARVTFYRGKEKLKREMIKDEK
jgi:RNA polymerase sigma-70 factor (ECF subfamily)